MCQHFAQNQIDAKSHASDSWESGKFGNNSVARAAELVLVACVCLFLGVTSLATLICTSTYPDYTGTPSLSFTTAPIAIAVMVAQTVVIWLLWRSGMFRRINERSLALVLAAYALVVGMAWALIADVWPEWDSSAIFDAAKAFGEEGSTFYQPGRYVERFPYQMPYILLVHYVDVLIGHRYVAMEGINALATAWMYYLLVMLAKELFQKRHITNICAVLLFCYLPPLFFTTFAYPNVIAFAFCVFAMVCQVRALKAMVLDRSGELSGRKYRRTVVVNIIGCALGAAMGYLFKSSMLLVLVAMACVWLIFAIKIRHLLPLLGVVATICLCWIGSTGVNLYVEAKTGIDTGRAMPTKAYIAMGLNQQSGGWYDGFLWSLDNGDESTYDPEAYERAAQEKIDEELQAFANDPAAAVTFAVTKFLTQWCDPTSESLLASNWNTSPSDLVMAERDAHPIARAVYYGPVHDALVAFLDGLQTLILIGALVAVIADPRARRIERMTPLLYAAGLALFYVVWEAKAQYVMTAYIALILFAAAGVAYIIERIECLRTGGRGSNREIRQGE